MVWGGGGGVGAISTMAAHHPEPTRPAHAHHAHSWTGVLTVEGWGGINQFIYRASHCRGVVYAGAAERLRSRGRGPHDVRVGPAAGGRRAAGRRPWTAVSGVTAN